MTDSRTATHLAALTLLLLACGGGGSIDLPLREPYFTVDARTGAAAGTPVTISRAAGAPLVIALPTYQDGVAFLAEAVIP